MLACPDPALMTMIMTRLRIWRELQSIVIRKPKKQPKRVARRKRLRRALATCDRAIAQHCQELFTP